MAAIDFPASPVNGQVFSASNGVSYIYSTTYGLWQAQPTSSGFVGDFCASSTVPGMVGGSNVVATAYTLMSGNAGGWLNTTTGRYTPPKGRYQLIAMMQTYSSVSLIIGAIALRKNGVAIPGATFNATSPAANNRCEPSVGAIVDANGTDYFEVTCYGNVNASGTDATFMAFPISPNANMVQGTGDFWASNSAQVSLPTASTVIFPDTVRTGNSGAYYSTTTGRYTPPAGRYLIFALLSFTCTTAASLLNINLRKNGTVIDAKSGTTPATNQTDVVTIEAIVDANGSDYFDLTESCTTASLSTGTSQGLVFGAFPISGIKGPQGDPGAVGQAGANPFNVRNTASDTLNGPAYLNLFRSNGVPVRDYDPDNVWDNTNGRFTAPNAGRYHFEGHAYSTANPAGQTMLCIQHQNNAGAVIRTYGTGGQNDTSAYGAAHHASVDLQMAAGDRVVFLIASNSGTCVTAATGTIGGLLSNALCYAFGNRIN